MILYKPSVLKNKKISFINLYYACLDLCNSSCYSLLILAKSLLKATSNVLNSSNIFFTCCKVA